MLGVLFLFPAPEAAAQGFGVTVSDSALSVPEEATATYTLVLDTQPTADVTITLAKTGDAHLTVAPEMLTFTTTDWSTAQTVTVSAADDPDTDNGAATIAHTATSTDSDYSGIAIASVTAREVENDTPSITLTATSLVQRVRFEWTVVGVYEGILYRWNESGGTAWGTFHTALGRSHEIDTTKLAPNRRFGHPFRFRVQGLLKGGGSISSRNVFSNVAEVEALPPKPGGLSATAAGADAVRLSWNAVTGPVAKYQYRYRLSSAGDEDWGAWTDASGTTASHTVTGLDNGTSYTFQVRVVAGNVQSAASDAATGIPIGPGVTVTPTTLEVNENGSATYTVVLDTQPATGPVTVTVAKTTGGDPHLTASPTALTFTTGNWSTARTVTVEAADDADSTHGTATFTHSASGADYGLVTGASVEATEKDDDTPGVTASTNMLAVPEGGSATYTVKLNTQPTDNVVLTLQEASASPDGGDLAVSPGALTFTTANWNTAQTVTVSAPQDDDASNGTRTIRHDALSLDADYDTKSFANVTATEVDDDTARVTVMPTNLSVKENGTATYTVVLDTLPTAAVTVGVAPSGDSDLRVSSTALTFTTANWSTAQTVTVRAGDDNDADDGEATIAHSASGADEYAGITIDSVDAEEADDDTPGLSLSPNPLRVTEGNSAYYTVKLDTQPPGNVTVELTKTGDSDLTFSPAALTFTTAAWNAAQTVSVAAAEDDDAADGEATILHRASGGYAGLTATLTVTEDDEDTAGVTVTPTVLTVTENGNATYTVVLDTQPATSPVTVTVAKTAGGDEHLAASPTALTFTTSNWNTAQTVTVSAADDDDGIDGAATFTHSASGADYGSVVIDSVTATESDNDTPGVTVNPEALPVTEGSTASYTVALNTQPSADVTVSLSASGDSDLTVSTTALTFTTSNWNTAQTVTVTAVDDDDAAPGTATITHTAASTDGDYNGITIAPLKATEDDNDTVGVTVTPKTLSVTEESTAAYTVVLDTLPTGSVTVSVAKQGGGDPSLTASPTALTFTTGNWSTAQTVTVSAADDVDSTNGAAIFTHSASGADYGSVVIDSVKATESDNDRPGLTVTPTDVPVNEGGTATWTVALTTQPTAAVTVSVGASGDGDLTASTSALTFTTANWNAAQTVTVSAGEDGDAARGEAFFTHSASGGGYDSAANVTVTVRETDNDTPGVTFSASALTVPEEGEATYTVVLDTLPTGKVTVRITTTPDARGDNDLSFTPTVLTFTTSNWNTPKTVTVRAANDADTNNGQKIIKHIVRGAAEYHSSGLSIFSVTATESDNDTPGVAVSENMVTVGEDSSATYTVKLNTEPTAAVTVTPAATGDSDLSVSGALTFTTANWDTAQTVTVTAADDDDAAPGTATITHTAASTDGDYNGITIAPLKATEDDNDTVGVTVTPKTLSVTEESTAAYTVVLDTLPTGSVTVSVAKQGGGDPSLTVSATALTFTTGNWNAAQTVTVSAADDIDGIDGAATFTHSASGADYGSVVIDSVKATESDNDTPGVTVNPEALPVAEGSTASYTVALTTQPSADVTVSLSASGDSDLTVSTTALTFTTADWNTAQTVTVTAAEDDDAAAGTATITHTAASTDSGYNGIAITIASVTATEDDNDTVGVTVAPETLSVTEESTAAYTVVLDTLPTGSVTVSVAKQAGGDPSLTVSATALTFTTGNWNAAQTVTVSAADDDDGIDGAATFTHSASGADYGSVVIASVKATESDNDTPGVTVNPEALPVAEGSTASYTVALTTQPSADVTVSLSASGDSDLTVSTTALTFTTSNWNTAQTVTVTAADDDDAAAGTATITHTAASTDSAYNGITSAPLKATENDDDTVGVTVTPKTLSVTEESTAAYTVVLDTLPTGSVTVSVAKQGGGDPSLTASPTALTFTTGNWSTAQTVTVSAADDVDSTNGAAIFTHSASGADYGSVVIDSVKATESDDDRPGVTVNPEALTVSEGRSATYTVALNTLPTGSVTVAVTASGDSDLTAAPTSLTFTTTDWNRAQTVTVSAADDGDAEDGTATFANTPSGADYASVTGAVVTATEDDDDTAGVTVSPARLTVNETGSETYTVVLNTLPTAAVTVGVAASGDSDLTVSATALTFTTGNWNTAQTVTVSAADDDDPDHGTATIAHTASGAGEYADVTIASVIATEADDDTPGVQLSTNALTVTEGGDATYTVVLNTLPPGTVTVTLSRTGDSDLTVSPARLTFTTDNWSTAQTATVSAAEDDDAAAGTATIRNRASGSGYTGLTATLTATEDDNDTAGVTVSDSTLTVNENGRATYTVVLDTRPTGTVRVAVAKQSDGDPSLTRSPTSLTFTVSNWSTPKTVTVRAADDVDSLNGTATFTHTATSSADSDYDAIAIASVTATEDDDDMPGLKLSRTAVTVLEGRSATYTVALNTLPTGSVTVAVTASGDSDDDLTAAPTSLTFTTTDWNRAQTVTVSAADDGDAEDGTATFTNTPSGADYASVTGAVVTATEDDGDTAGVTVTPARLTVNENGSETYTVVLNTLPTAAVTVGVAASGDSDLTVSATSLTFSTANWNTAQTVTVSAADDDDPNHGTATIAHTASGASEYADISIASVAATEADDDTPGVKLSTNALTVTEGGSATYTVVLNTLPPGTVTVTLSRTGDSDLTVSPARLTFTTDNWSTAQTATVSAAEDDDAAAGTATIRNRASGSGYTGLTATLTATEDDNDTAGVTVSASTLTVNENGRATYTVVLDTRPTGTVRVAVAKTDDSDPSLTRSPTSLTFTASNWSTPKTVTVRAADDADSLNGTATFTHAATSSADSDYNAITIASVEATEADDDTPGLKLSRTSVTVSEGRSATYTVALNTLPTGSVTVAVTASGDSDSDLTTAPTSLTFTTTDWNRAQTVTVSAADDGDAEDGTATFTNTSSGADYASVTGAIVTATEDDNDTAGVTVTPRSLTVNETGSATYTVVLDTLPTAAVTVGVAASGDSDLTVSATSLTFSTANWNTAQTVTVSAADDADPDHGTATIAHTASGASEYADISIASVAATEADDDTPGVQLSTNALTVTEGGSANYTVVLNTLPPGNVTVTLSRRTGDSDLTVSPARLTFTTDNWSTAQTATVSAAEDDDAAVGTATIRNRASGSGYSGLKAELTATEDDNDTAGVTVSPETLTVNENGSEKYTVVLHTRPTGTVRVSVGTTDDSDPSLTRSPTSLTFTVSNWSRPKTVTVRAADDADSTNGEATFTHAATSSADSDYADIAIASVTATESDDDMPGLKLSRTAVTVLEGRSATYTVKLNTEPTAAVTVTPSAAGDGDLTFAPAALTFATSDWSRAQTVTVSAADDGDAEDGTATITHTAASGDSAYNGITLPSVTATEADDGTTKCTAGSTAVSAYSGAGIVADCKTLLGLKDELRGTASLNWSPDTAMAGWDGITVSGNRVTQLDLDVHEFTGSLPPELGQLTSLETLELISISLSGSIPPELGQLTSLETLDLHWNDHLSGSLPSELGQLTNLKKFDLRSTQVSGLLPPEWGRMTSLTGLSLRANELSGSIPPELGQITGLNVLTLHDNRFTGCIPFALRRFRAEGDINPQKGSVSLPVCLGSRVQMSKSMLTVPEGGMETYTVVLGHAPTAAVTVTPAATGDGDLTLAPAALTFTTSNWNTAQTVTVSAAEDADTANGAATITHTASSTDSDYNGITNSVRAREADNDAAANAAPTFTSGATFTVAENETAVGTVVATDSDAGDRITGYALTGGADRAQFSITRAGALTFDTAPDYESPVDADTDNVYVVVVEATSGASGRARTATQTLTVTVTDVEVPSAPPAPAVSGETADSVTVSWTAPANPGSAITGYDVQYRVSGAASWTDAGHSGTGLTLTLTGLTAGTDYEVQVRASNAEGPGAWSASATATTTTTAVNVAPTFTSGAMFTVAENETAVGTVVATDSDAGDTLTGYALTGGADQAKFTITSAGALTFDTAPDYESPTDADTDNAYVVVVEATSGEGERVMTATQPLTVTVTDVGVPSAPPAPAVSGETADSVTVSWTAPANPGPAIIDYDVQYRVSGAASWTDAGHSGTGLTLTLTGLTASTDYEVQVRASNAEGPGAWSASAIGTTTAVNVAPTFTSGAAFTVAENETAVGTVVAMDADAGDRITGYALTGGADRARFSITRAGALTFTSAPDYESPTDADTDNVYVVVVEATSGAGERVMTATQAITVTVTDQSEVPSAPSAPVISGETASSLTVTWTAPANPGSAITDYDVQYRVSGAASWTDAGHSGTGLTLTLTDLTAITDYEVQVRASNAEGTGAWSASATATTTANEAAERIERAAETVQPEVSRAMVSETLEVVTQRIERPRDGQAQASLGGRSSFSELLQSHEAALNGEVELDWRRVLGTSSFSLPLSETDQPGAGGGLEVWGRGAWRSLSGGSAGELTWKGEMLSAHLGADWRLRRELLAGVALSWHEGDVDYDVVDGTKRVKGTSRSRMTSVHPYLGWFPSEGSSLWMSAGYGRGTVEVDDEGRHSGDSEMRMVGAGGRVRVLSSEGWLGGGTSSLDVKGEGWVARTEVSGNGGMLADDTVDARRVRLALEGAHERRLASGSVLTPVLELGVRHDGGDGETGVGVEIGGGLRYADADAGLSSEVRVRGLAAHQGALDE